MVETRDVTENILIELDKDGDLVSMTIEHAKQHWKNSGHLKFCRMPDDEDNARLSSVQCMQTCYVISLRPK
jgi:uncharacterized protein DUF2283